DGKLQLNTYIQGNEIPWTDKNLLKTILRFPLFTFGVVFLIHYQALLLLIKGCQFYSLPEKTKKDVTHECSF
ncbi:MAG: DUF1365 family protein, partial [Bdellovibrionales bacterium]|nr:DUF1365 family protein [Bdellovibrionales bacterium]